MVAVESYIFGRDLAVAIHRRTNPDLQREADACKGILVNRDLPDLERRFLSDSSEPDSQDDLFHLQQWKDSTHHHRVNGTLRDELFEIERAIMVENVAPSLSSMEVARDAGWEVKSLQNWKDAQVLDTKLTGNNMMELWLNLCVFLVATGLLLWGATSVTNSVRTYCIAGLFAPFGTILRWRLSSLNGSITNSTWEWLPIGTFTANMIATALSCLIAAISLRIDGKLALTYLAAFQNGFAGALSTVSTLVVESVELLRALPQHAYSYYYSLGSLVSAGILGVICYVWAVV
jgi:fluoride ion exporter CrcB/FEX